MSRIHYVTRAALAEDGDLDYCDGPQTSAEVMEVNRPRVVDTKLLNAAGEPILRRVESVMFGFQGRKKEASG